MADWQSAAGYQPAPHLDIALAVPNSGAGLRPAGPAGMRVRSLDRLPHNHTYLPG